MRYDVLTSRKDKDGKWRSTRIGAAFPQEEGRIAIVLDALPVSIWEGQVRMTLFPAKEKDAEQSITERAVASVKRPPSVHTDMDDEVPF